MVYKVVIKDNTNSPLKYLPELKNFKNGTEYEFKPGVNVIVGENGCGKTTLMKLIKAYLMVDFMSCGAGMYRCNLNKLYDIPFGDRKLLDGVDVYADYQKNTFRLSHAGEKEYNQAVETFEDFGAMFEQKNASTGEGVVVALNSLWNHMYGRRRANPFFDYSQFKESDPLYWEYVQNHHQEGVDEWTILMDEPDRNLSLDNIGSIKEVLSFHKEQTQIIAVVHNPLLICSLSKNKEVNMIEMTKGYIQKTKKLVKELMK